MKYLIATILGLVAYSVPFTAHAQLDSCRYKVDVLAESVIKTSELDRTPSVKIIVSSVPPCLDAFRDNASVRLEYSFDAKTFQTLATLSKYSSLGNSGGDSILNYLQTLHFNAGSRPGVDGNISKSDIEANAGGTARNSRHHMVIRRSGRAATQATASTDVEKARNTAPMATP